MQLPVLSCVFLCVTSLLPHSMVKSARYGMLPSIDCRILYAHTESIAFDFDDAAIQTNFEGDETKRGLNGE